VYSQLGGRAAARELIAIGGTSAAVERYVIMTTGVVVVYFSRLGGRLREDQKRMLAVNAQMLAKLKDYDFGGDYQTAHDYSGPLFFVPDDTLLVDEAESLGIRLATDLYGGVVPHPFVKTKTITHQLVDDRAQRPPGWSTDFAERVRSVALPGYSVFSIHDARAAARRMLDRGAIRLKRPLCASGKGQKVVTTAEELDAFLEQLADDELATYGLVLEESLSHVRTLSVGQIAVDNLTITYHGMQRRVKDNEGRSIYGGSDLVCLRGGWDALDAVPMTAETRAGIIQARLYDETMHEYPGFTASRRNYDVGQGIDANGRWRSGVFESSWRAGGASSAELAALAEFVRDPFLQTVEASAVEQFGEERNAPADALIHFDGDDPEVGPLLRYTVVKGARPSRGQ
jgi:hypothetical protein